MPNPSYKLIDRSIGLLVFSTSALFYPGLLTAVIVSLTVDEISRALLSFLYNRQLIDKRNAHILDNTFKFYYPLVRHACTAAIANDLSTRLPEDAKGFSNPLARILSTTLAQLCQSLGERNTPYKTNTSNYPVISDSSNVFFGYCVRAAIPINSFISDLTGTFSQDFIRRPTEYRETAILAFFKAFTYHIANHISQATTDIGIASELTSQILNSIIRNAATTATKEYNLPKTSLEFL